MSSRSNANTVIVGYGDSITLSMEQSAEKKWLTRLGRSLAEALPGRNFTMVNSGVGGETSREGLARIEPAVLAHQPDVVLVEFGGNDATHDPARHVPVTEFQANLETMRAAIVDRAKAEMALLVFPPVIDEWHCWSNEAFYKPYGGLDGCLEQYRQATREFARTHRLVLADIDRALREAGKKDGNGRYIKPDGVHLTDDGNQVVTETVHRALVETI